MVETPHFHCRGLTHWKRPWCWEEWGQEEKGSTEEEMVGWHHWLYGLCGVWASSGNWWWTGKPNVISGWGISTNCAMWQKVITIIISLVRAGRENLFQAFLLGLWMAIFSLCLFTSSFLSACLSPLLLFFFLAVHRACRILVPWTGSQRWRSWVLTIVPPGNSPNLLFLKDHLFYLIRAHPNGLILTQSSL